MDSQLEGVENRLETFLAKLQAEQAIFERIVYKNKNQHRRCPYFRYLLKVRRDLRLLHAVNLKEQLGSCFQVISGKKPKQKLHLLQSLKGRKPEYGRHSFLDQLLGAARLLSQMTEPMLKAAMEISTLLARSFFIGFSLTILALLARLRVLVQQMLLDIGLVFNAVTSIAQNKQSFKIAQDGVEVYREYYPTSWNYVTLDCVWQEDKYVLHEKTEGKERKIQEGDAAAVVPLGNSSVQYHSIQSFLQDVGITEEDNLSSVAAISSKCHPESNSEDNACEPKSTEGTRSYVGSVEEDNLASAAAVWSKYPPESNLEDNACEPKSAEGTGSYVRSAETPNSKAGMNRLAFVSVKRPVDSTAITQSPRKKIADEKTDQDKLYDLLSGGLRESLLHQQGI